jgi:hypothetical protein
VVATSFLTVAGHASAQKEPATETKTGTITEVQGKGRVRTLVVDMDGKSEKVPVTAKVALEIIASGDAGFVRPEQFLSATATMSNDRLFAKELTIRALRKGQKAPDGEIKQPEAAFGESKNAYEVSGMITGVQPDPDFPDHQLVMLMTADGSETPVMLEPGYSVTVIASDPAKIPANTEAELKIATLRGGKTSVVRVTVRLNDSLQAAEYFGDKATAAKPGKPAKTPAGKQPFGKKPAFGKGNTGGFESFDGSVE